MRAKSENQRNMKLLATFLTTIHGVSLPPSLGWFNSYCDMIPCDRSGMQVCGSDGVTYANECERIRESCRQGTLGLYCSDDKIIKIF